MEDKPISEQVDDIIQQHAAWKGEIVAAVRSAVLNADPSIVEEIKWRMKSRPEGLAVWTSNGIVCFAEILKDNVKLIFFKGAELKNQKPFNARLDSSTVRAIEYREGDTVHSAELKDLVLEAIAVNK